MPKYQICYMASPWEVTVEETHEDEPALRQALRQWMEPGDQLVIQTAPTGARALFICPPDGEPTDIFGRILP
jgi:hypothetical protein